MEPVFSTWGAIAGLVLAIVLIIRKVTPAYALIYAEKGGILLGCECAKTTEKIYPVEA